MKTFNSIRMSALGALSVFFALSLVAVPTVVSAGEDMNTVCISSTGRIVSIPEPGEACRRGYSSVPFGASGPQGEPGANGENGDPGPQGPSGSPSTQTATEIVDAVEQIFCKAVDEEAELTRQQDGTIACETPSPVCPHFAAEIEDLKGTVGFVKVVDTPDQCLIRGGPTGIGARVAVTGPLPRGGQYLVEKQQVNNGVITAEIVQTFDEAQACALQMTCVNYGLLVEE